MRHLLPVALALLSAVASSAQPNTEDAILIIGISPESFEDGKESPVDVTIAYDLTSSDEAVLDLGSNELMAHGFQPVAHTLVKKGNGTVTISGKLVPRYWSSSAPAKVSAHLTIDDDSPSRRRVLAADNTRIVVTRRARPPESDPRNPNPSVIYDDTVSIKSVTPDNFVAGQETEVAVTVAYELLSREEGEINLGCNLGRGNGYQIIARTLVKIGSGETVVKARFVPTRTGKMPFAKIFVNLSEYPHRQSWAPLANDSHTLEVR
jgi:hypothetical protein